MAPGKTRAFQAHRLVIALVVIAGCAATCLPASAQVYWGDRPSGGYWGDRQSGGYWGDRYRSDRYWGDRYRSDRWQAPSRDLFPFFGDRYQRPPPPAVDYSKAPPPRKLETPPTSTVVVVGDSMAIAGSDVRSGANIAGSDVTNDTTQAASRRKCSSAAAQHRGRQDY